VLRSVLVENGGSAGAEIRSPALAETSVCARLRRQTQRPTRNSKVSPSSIIMMDPKSPYPPVLSPSSSNLFSDIELTKPIRIKFSSAAAASTTSPQAEWKQVAREVEADIRIALS